MWFSASNVKLFLAYRALSFTPKSITAIVTENISQYSPRLCRISPRRGLRVYAMLVPRLILPYGISW